MTKEKEPEALRRPRHAGRPTEDAAPAGRRGSCDEKPTVRRAPPSHEKSSVAIVERKGQSYEAAALRRERSRASFGTDNLADWERFLARAEALVPLSQVELSAYAQMKLVLADYALRVLSGRVKPADKKDLPKPDELYRAATPEGLDAVRRRILEGVRFYRKRSAKRAGKRPRTATFSAAPRPGGSESCAGRGRSRPSAPNGFRTPSAARKSIMREPSTDASAGRTGGPSSFSPSGRF